MADRVYPSSKPANSNPPKTLNGNATASKPQQVYGANRATYRPQPRPQHRHRRSCCCLYFLWTTILLIALLPLAAIAGAVLWVLYRPQMPIFSVSALRISQFNITTSKDSSSHLNSKLDLTVSARNPNKKLVFFYDSVDIAVKSKDVDVGKGSVSFFVHGTKNMTVLRSVVSNVGGDLDVASVTSLKSDLNRKNGLPLEIQLETKVKVKMDGLKTKKFGIRVSCEGIHAVVPKGKSPSPASFPGAKWMVNLRIKIWK